MNPKIKQKWIEALESGEYIQGQRALKAEADGEIRHCCLGVLCEIYMEEIGEDKWGHGEIGFYFDDGKISKNTGHLPDEVCAWADLDTQLGDFYAAGGLKTKGKVLDILGGDAEKLYSVGEVHLAAANDHGFDFKKIANLIRGLF